ncbi:hypothetical protein K144316041_p21340 (plasmid) [Clostridium tetani]|uniref:phage antirepressor KilAC domain-containing protein n=1 Tax=Clostridium tetani TaxID=1513 RepID=UPI002955504B|nr:phage antirepressor KilAC domain-containing protein [Clostridium tetani]BDR74295.1 hypothetical protein K144316041_p21340 [Clostridium tetani]
MVNENELLEKKDLREEMIGKVEVLDKVKKLILLPDTEYATKKQVAKYYEVKVDAIESIERRNKEELLSDGYNKFSSKDIKTLIGQVDGIKIPNTGMNLFPRRAILRVGMLLRDSEVAKEVRTQLLNIEEKTTEEQKTDDINKEKLLFMNIMFAENDTDRAVAVNELYKYNARNKEKVDYYDSTLHCDKLITTRDVAKDLGLTDRKLYKILRENRILYKNGNIYKPYAEYDFLMKENYADYHITEYGQTLKWYEKGRKWIVEHIEEWKNNIK